MQILSFTLKERFLKKLADDQCSSITKGSIYFMKQMYIQPFTTVVDWPEIWRWMKVSTVFFTWKLSWYGRSLCMITYMYSYCYGAAGSVYHYVRGRSTSFNSWFSGFPLASLTVLHNFWHIFVVVFSVLFLLFVACTLRGTIIFPMMQQLFTSQNPYSLILPYLIGKPP